MKRNARLHASILVLLACACGGGGGGAPAQCNGDTDCPGAGTHCIDHVCQATLTVQITSPAAATTYTSGILHVEVAVVNGSASSVLLLVDGVLVATLAAPFRTDWDCSARPERSYQLVARVVAGAQHYDSEPRTVTVDRTPPSKPTVNAPPFTNQRPTPVSGTTEPRATVTIAEGGHLIATATAREDGAWATDLDLAPGPPHALRARATDLAGNSTPEASSTAFSISVDQTPLTISARAPAPGATNVWSRDAINVTFDKPLAPASVTASAASIRLVRIDALPPGASTTVDFDTPQLSDGDTRLSLRPSTIPQGPCSLTLTLPASLTDVYGNALAETQWRWTIPEWQDLGTPFTYLANHPVPRIALSSDGRPAIGAYWETSDAVTLAEWSGPTGGWAVRLDGSSGEGGYVGWKPSVDFDAAGRPLMAWVDGGAFDARHGRWDGARFVVSPSGGRPSYAAEVRVDWLGDQVMAWVESEGGQQRVVGRSWNGDWTSLGSPTGPTADAVDAIDASRDAHGDVRFVWNQDAELVGATWSTTTGQWVQSTVGGAFGALVPSGALEGFPPTDLLKVDAAARFAYFAVSDRTTAPGVVLLRVHQSSCTVRGACKAPALGDGVNGGALNVNLTASATDASLALDPDGSPLVAWSEGQKVYVKRWDPTASAWRQLGATDVGSEGRPATRPSLVVGADGVVAVAFAQDYEGRAGQVRVKRYNGSWTLMAPLERGKPGQLLPRERGETP